VACVEVGEPEIDGVGAVGDRGAHGVEVACGGEELGLGGACAHGAETTSVTLVQQLHETRGRVRAGARDSWA
jgi:hypothetical protein